MANSSVIPNEYLAPALRYVMHNLVLLRNSLDAQSDRVESLRKTLDTQTAQLDAVERELKKILKAGQKPVPGSPVPRDHGAPVLAPGLVADTLMTQPGHGNSLQVAINGGKTFTLPARLAQVFSLIASGEKGRNAQDELIGWRSRTEIIEWLAEHKVKRISRKYLAQIVYLLKQALMAAGYDPRLIQSDRRKGIRLAYKHSPQDPPHPRPDADSPR